MKFTCDKCNKKYGIDNKKLENYGPTFKIRCQRCNHIIVVTNPYSKKKPVLSNREWYLFINNEQIGPLTIEEIKDYIDSGDLTFSTLVWKVGMPDWQQAQNIDDLKHLIKLPIRTSERRKNQSEKLNMLYDEFESQRNSIDENAFDEDEKTLTREEFERKKQGNLQTEEKKNEQVITKDNENLEEDSDSVSPDDFFNKEFEEKKMDKDSKLLRSLTGNTGMGNTGIFVMYNQKRKKERILFFSILTVIIIVGVSIIIYFKNKEPKTIVKEKIKTQIKYKDRIKVVEKVKYVEVKGSDGKIRRVKASSLNKAQKDNKENKINNDNEPKLYDRNLTTSSSHKKVAIKPIGTKLAASNGPTGNYGRDVAKVVNESKKSIFWCYRKALKTEPDLVAKAYFRLKISATGRVNSISSKFKPSKYNDSEMADCMEKKIKLWKFPMNPDGESIEFKFSIALKAN